MKNLAFVLSAFAVLFLFSCTHQQGASAPATVAVAPSNVNGLRIAYVNTDSLESKYLLLKTKQEEFKTKQDQMESELQHSYQQMQSDADEVQKKAQSNSLTQPEYEAAQKRLMQMQQSLETRKQSLTDELLKEKEDFNKDLKVRLDAFLEQYNKEKHYDYILSYSAAGSPVLFANKQMDITDDVVKGMNESVKADSDKKK